MFKNSVSNIPAGVAIRKLTEDRRAQHQKKAYKFSAWYHSADKTKTVVYGDTVRECLSKLEESSLELAVK